MKKIISTSLIMLISLVFAGCTPKEAEAEVTYKEVGGISEPTRVWNEAAEVTEAEDTEEASAETEDTEEATTETDVTDEELGYQAEADFADEQNSVDDYIIMYFKDVTGNETEARYAKQQANIRKGPSIQYDVVGQLEINQKIDAIGYVCIEGSEDVALWYVIKTDDGSTQMVNANLMTEKEPGSSGTDSGDTGDTGDFSSDSTTWPDEYDDGYGHHRSRNGFVYGDPSTYSEDGWNWFIGGQITRCLAGEITEEEYLKYTREYRDWQYEVTGNGVQDEYGEPDGEGGLHWG